jgi:CBS domain-containing protein
MPIPELLSDATIQFLIRFAPFSRMAAADLQYLAEHARLAYYPADAVIVDADAGHDGQLHIIHRGFVRSEQSAQSGGVVLGPGECFPLAAPAEASCTGRFVATEDVFSFELSGEHVGKLRLRSAPFREFIATALAAVLKESLSSAHLGFLGRTVNQGNLLEPLSGLVHRDAVACTADTPIRESLARMSKAEVGTIVVVDEARQPVGIFTLTDLMERVVLPQRPLDDPVASVMTPAAASLEDHASAQDAIALMASRGFHQLLVTRNGALTGVISERDLFALQRVSIRGVLQQVRAASGVADLRSATRDIVSLTDNLIAQGVAAEHLTRVITALNDGVSQRVLELLQAEFTLGVVPWCWLALGSEGRCEQTMVSDQDNAIIFDPPAAQAEQVRERLLPFAKAVNQALADLGFPLCRGNIMASNPACCLSTSEWRARFADWMREPTAQALLNANIFFDLRPLFGAADLAAELRSWVLDRAGDQRLFLGLLTENALQSEPPLGLIRAFRTDDADFPGRVDLKTQGTRLFVDAARVFALEFGLAETHTAQRLRLGMRHVNLPERDLAGLIQSFEFLQLLRFRAQCGSLSADHAEHTDHADHNRIDPYALSDPDQRFLKEAFRQARNLQMLLKQSIAR